MKTKKFKNGSQEKFYSRLDFIDTSWEALLGKAGVEDLQMKDLRTFLNNAISSKFGFNSKESGAYIGNSEEVNKKHYTFAVISAIQEKMKN